MGGRDGSIHADLDKKRAVFFAFFASFSMLYAASESDKSMWRMLDLNEDDFLCFSFDMIAKALV